MIIGKLICNVADEGEVRFIKEFDNFSYVWRLDILGDIRYYIDQKYKEAYNEMGIKFIEIKRSK